MRCGRPTAALIGLVALGLAAGCGGGDGADLRVPDGTPIVLISIDTLRSDRLPAYGYDEVATPAIDALRRDSILFAHAYSPVPLTLPAHVTALTGLLPPGHGVRDNMGYRLDAAGLPYLPRLLREAGYATGAAVSTFVLRGSSGLDTAFDFFDDEIVFTEWTDVGSVQRRGSETLERIRPWLRETAGGPFFLFFHLYEPHSPWLPPEPYASRYDSAYDGEVAAADEVVGELLAELERLGLYDGAVVVLMSDHGEGLGDHGYYEHGPLLYREAVQVPLMLKLPGARRGGTTVEAPAQLADIVPTLLGLLGIEPPAGLDGSSLLALEPETGDRAIYSETLYPRIHFGWSDLASLVDYPYHYIHGPDPELYDLEQDPAELTNILRREQRLARELKERLDGFERRLEAPGEEDPETLRKLAALGYLGGGGTSFEDDGPLPDPKSRLHVLEMMREALNLSSTGQREAAVGAFRALLAEEPGMADAWEKLGFELLELGRHQESLEAFREAMRHSGGAPQVALSMADALLRMGRLEEARAHAEIALDTHELARDLLAQVALRQGDLERAEEIAVESVANRGTRLGPLITLADLRLKQERHRDAIELTEQAEREFGERLDVDKLRGLYFIRGRAWAELGEVEPAAAAFRREIELSPRELAPYTHLAYLLALAGDAAGAGATLRRMVETNPRPEAYADAVRTLEAMGDPASARAVLEIARRRWPGNEALEQL